MSKPIKYCILDSSKICDDCKECERCDLDPSKICDNCGKCLNLDDDYKEVRIDGIADKEVSDEYLAEEMPCGSSDDSEKGENCDGEDPKWEYIDDVDGLDEILNDKKQYSPKIVEEYPGLLRLKNNNNDNYTND